MAKFDHFEEVTDIGRNNPFGRELTEAIKKQVSTWIPDKCLRNIELKADETFTETSIFKRKYLRDNYVGLDKSPRFDEFLTATAIANMIPVSISSPIRVLPGSGYSPSDELTVVGGVFTEVALLIVFSVETIVGQDETDYNGAGSNGTFGIGSGYSASSTITMSDGTGIVVDSIGDGGAVATFHITAKSTSGHTSNGDMITQAFTNAESGAGFTMTLGIANQGVFAATHKIVSETIVGIYQDLPLDPVSTTDTGSGATFNINWGVRDVTVIDGGSGYLTPPAVTFTPSGGATAVATLDADVVSAITVTSSGAGFAVRAEVTVESPC